MKALAVIAGIIVGVSGWVVGASALLCVFTRQWRLFVFPFDQWVLAVRWYKAVGWTMRAAIVGSAIPPTLVTLLMIAIVVRKIVKHRARRLVRQPGGALRDIDIGVTDNLGHAAFASPEEVHARFSGSGCLIGAADRTEAALQLFDDVNRGPGHSMVFAGPGSDKAQPLDAKVLTPTGFRLMGELQVGDLVQTPDGKSAPIIGVFPQGEKDIYRVTFADGRSVECCDDHLWKVWSRTWTEKSDKPPGKYLSATQRGKRSRGWRVLPLSQIRARLRDKPTEWKRTAIPLVAPFAIELPHQDLPVTPYAMGALLGDGHLASGISISTADPPILERVLADLPEYRATNVGEYDYRLSLIASRSHAPARFNPLTMQRPAKEKWFDRRGRSHFCYLFTHDGRTQTIAQWARERGMITATVYQRIFRMGWHISESLGFTPRPSPNKGVWSPLPLALQTLGIGGTRSDTKFIPECYKRGSVAQRLALLQGLLDTDGSVGNGTHAIFISTSERLAKDIQDVAWSLGAIAKVRPRQTYCTYKGVYTAGKPSWIVSIVHPDVSAMFSLPRKVARCKKKGMQHRLGISAIEHIGRKLTQCIRIDSPDSLYVTDNYIVTHNTTTAITRIWHWPGPCVVFDPSLEIGPIMTDALRRRSRKVVTIGLTGHGVNVLDWIDIRHPEADVYIRSAVDWIYDEGAAKRGNAQSGGENPYWANWGRDLVTCLLAHMLYARGGPRTLYALRRGIATPENEMPRLLAGIYNTSNSAMARDIAGGLMGMEAKETFSGIYSNAFKGTSWLGVGAYADVVSGSAMRTADILDSDTVVFVQLPMRSLQATPAVGRALMGALFNAMFHADGSNESRILFELDEAWVLGRLKEVMLCHTTARKYRGCVQQIFQSEAQLEEVWGREGAKTMRDTLSWRSYNCIQDGEVAEKLSRDMGEHAVLAYSEGINSGSQKPWGISLPSSSRGSNVNTHEIKRRLVKADEIMRSPADRMFVLARDFSWPIDCVTAPYWRYTDLKRVMQSNRFVKAAE